MDSLWLALDLPRLPLEAHSGLPGPSPAPGRRQDGEPAAVSAAGPRVSPPEDGEEGKGVPVCAVAGGRLVACDDDALAAGVAPGMGLAAARAMAPRIAVVPCDAAREEAALTALACWAGRFTPRVALAPPQALLLEIGGCLRLFGGADAIVAAATAGVAEQGFHAHAAVAPTPQGALWLAQGRTAAICLDAAMLRAALDALPLAPLDLPAAAKAQLAGFGARRLVDARRLPAAGLARRIGAAAVAALARAYGEAADPRRDFAFPERFAQGVEFPAPVDNAAALLFAGQRLVAALAGWLEARQGGIAGCELHLCRRAGDVDVVDLRFAAATRDAARIGRVLRERVERLTLAAPVAELRLLAAAVAALPGRSGTLFAGAEAANEGIAALVERLRARLGEACVHGLAVAADHRPECATRQPAAGQGTAIAAAPPRPFWLLAAPEPLAERAGRPWRRGPLRLLAGPERIEAGWWDGGEGAGDARRDYFVALTADARWAWVYRELAAPGGWFLHGWFG